MARTRNAGSDLIIPFRKTSGVGSTQLSVREVAELLKVSERKVQQWIKSEGLPAYRVNEQFRVNRAELLEWATARNLPVPADLFQTDDDEPSPVNLARALAAGGVFHAVGGSDRQSVLQAVVDAMQLPPAVNRDLLFRVLLAREALGSTAIGDGIAIPHPRNPIVLHIDRPAVALCFLASPIDFGAMDGRPVHTLFTLVSPTVRDHLQLLSRLAFALKDGGFKAAIGRRASKDEMLGEAHRVEAGLRPHGGTSEPAKRKPKG